MSRLVYRVVCVATLLAIARDLPLNAVDAEAVPTARRAPACRSRQPSRSNSRRTRAPGSRSTSRPTVARSSSSSSATSTPFRSRAERRRASRAGKPFDAQPHYSPDGKSIVFVSDRAQSDNLWIMNADGTSPRADHAENDQKFQSPRLHARREVHRRVEGQRRLHVLRERRQRRHSSHGRFRRGRRTWRCGGGRGGATAPNVFLGPAPSKDGRYIYFAMRNSTGGGYNQTVARLADRRARSSTRAGRSRRRTPSAAACAPS